MGFYSPPLRAVVDAVLAPGYTPPTHDGSDAQLSDSGPYAYRPPSRTVVDAVLSPGYTAPDALACDATLRRPLGSGEQKISPLGWDASTVSAAHVKLYLSFVQPIGWESGAVAAPTVRNAEERIHVVGGVSRFDQASAVLRAGYTPHDAISLATLTAYRSFAEIGIASVQEVGVDVVRVQGWESAAIGAGTWVRNNRQHISTGGSSYMALGGGHNVSLYTRYLIPAGVDAQQYGVQWASHWLRYITAAGVGDKTARGTPWVSRSPRELAPTGFDAMKVLESHVVGGTRYISPAGTEMTQWGTRIIPEGQVAYPQGFVGDVGAPDVQLHTRYLRPQPFKTNPDDLRFGRQDVWNLRQVAQQDYDPADGLNPPPFGQWTGIENRNKEPVPVGWLSERIGYQFVWNKASPVTPAGIEAPPTGVGSVTHWRRAVVPGGIDSLSSERWHATYNKAAPLRAQGDLHQDFGQPALENRSRLYDKVGNFDTMTTGTPMVSDAIRTLTFESRYSIEPPAIELPRVDLYTRYIEGVSVGDRLGAGSPVLDIRWTIISPKWSFHPPAFVGEPALHNVTPELRTGGANHEEFGSAAIRTQWRRLETKDGDMAQWGRPTVRDRRHWVEFVTVGAPPSLMPGPKVTKIGGLPDPQGVQPLGIGQTQDQVPPPLLNLLFAYPEGIDSQKHGRAVVTANSIRVEPGYWEDLVGKPAVANKNRTIAVKEFTDVYQPPKAAVSPHTIWAVVEAPIQAVENHDATGLHYVDHDPTTNHPLKYVPQPTVTLQNRRIYPAGFTWPSPQEVWPTPKIANSLQYILPKGTLANYFGVPSVPGEQAVEQFESKNFAVLGSPIVDFPPYAGPQTISPGGLEPPGTTLHGVDFLRRTRQLGGWSSMRMGESKAGDTPFQWQGLRVGPLVPNIPEGFCAEQYGTPWVSLAVRDLPVQGWDSFEVGYDVSQFDKRMRVTRTPTPRPPTQGVGAVGIGPVPAGTPDARRGTHYIRPDGNADVYRKGAPQ